MNILRRIFGLDRNFGAMRSPKWRKIRREHLKMFPACAVCEGKRKAVPHHIKPFHLYPELELEPTNLITLCERKKYGINCHLLMGHYGNFRRVNYQVIEDANIWHTKLKK